MAQKEEKKESKVSRGTFQVLRLRFKCNQNKKKIEYWVQANQQKYCIKANTQ